MDFISHIMPAKKMLASTRVITRELEAEVLSPDRNVAGQFSRPWDRTSKKPITTDSGVWNTDHD